MKQKIALAATAVILVSLMITGGTLAWFTDETTATNIVTTGSVKIALHDSATDIRNDDGIVIGDLVCDFAPVEGIVPGKQVAKFVAVKNTGNNSAFVRVQILPVWYREAHEGEQGGEDGLIALTAQELEDADIVNGGIAYTVDADHWTARSADGYYIFKGELAAGEVTPTLLSKVTFDTAINNNAFGLTLKINVKAEATQSENRGTATYEDVWEIIPA